MNIFDSTGQAQRLGNEIARGGEGAVYPLASRPSVVVKLYHDDLLLRRGKAQREKAEVMLSIRKGIIDAPLA
ncbi:MAG TPA: hypothetical protein PKY10_13800 [Lentisphaeria bacterium]|jgi:DNA-binding helix-hairpin-helix protein with protein kinase domain|nr:hypothetical protein [Lentisphaeria bacterium]